MWRLETAGDMYNVLGDTKHFFNLIILMKKRVTDTSYNELKLNDLVTVHSSCDNINK